MLIDILWLALMVIIALGIVITTLFPMPWIGHWLSSSFDWLDKQFNRIPKTRTSFWREVNECK